MNVMNEMQRFVLFLADNPGPVKRWEFRQAARATAQQCGLAEIISPKEYKLTATGQLYARAWKQEASAT